MENNGVKKRKERPAPKIKPSVSGTMKCENGHSWGVADLNPECITRFCPTCGSQTTISKALIRG